MQIKYTLKINKKKKLLKNSRCSADILNVGSIVPLPNHYISDCLKGAGPVYRRPFFLMRSAPLFPTGILLISPFKTRLAGDWRVTAKDLEDRLLQRQEPLYDL